MDPKEGLMKQQAIKCAECGGTLEERTINHTQQWGEELYRFEDVPALVCAQCGHVWLAAEVSQRIDQIIREHPKPKAYQKVPVFSLLRTKAKGAGAGTT
ncbi:MAG: type II toxin-antitoxin system MqsA family antitoxin [Acidobacteria bacterium]|nr:type II toxin-antitoxin system MqsA family antitoxin [Acidobacteriota bacterium]